MRLCSWSMSQFQIANAIRASPDPALRCGIARRRPSTCIPLPSRAAAAARLQDTSGPPAFSTRRAARCPVPRALLGSLPATRDTSRHNLLTAETPECPAARFPAPLGSLSVGGTPPSARDRDVSYGAFANASTAQRCTVAAGGTSGASRARLTTPDAPARQPHLQGGNVNAAHWTTPSLRPHHPRRLLLRCCSGGTWGTS